MRRGFQRKFEPIKILTDSQIEAIHRATLDVLEKTGIKFESERALKLLEKNGCRVDYENRIARIPGFLVEECIRKTPSSFSVKARDKANDLRIGGNTLYFMSSAGARYTDAATGEVRMATQAENDQGVLISDALETIDVFPSYTPYFEIEGVEPVMLCPVSCASRIRYTSKVSRGAQATDTFIFETQLAQAAEQQLIGVCEAAAPLSYPEDAINAAFEYTGAGFPMFIAAGSIMGGSAPVTAAGATITNNAELLGAVVLIQCMRPGTGIVGNDFVTPMDMQSGGFLFGALGVNLHQMAFNQLWTRVYEIPTVNTGAAFSNSKLIDYQSGYEKTHTAMVSALSGANCIVLHGGVTAELAYNPLLSIINDDVAAIIGRTIEGFEVNSETMALDLIHQVGVNPGSYLGEKHTRVNWQKEYFVPRVADRLSYQEWLAQGRKSVIDKARERMEEILAAHKPLPITPEQDKDLDRILDDARRHYRKKGLL
ncbi:MAG: trimethylamine methyltransferase family protein [Spirochaetota bacterium]